MQLNRNREEIIACFCRERSFKFLPENEVFAEGSARNTVALMCGHGTDGKDHVKIIDIYKNTSAPQLKAVLAMTPDEAINKWGSLSREQQNFVPVRCSVAWYENNRIKYKYRNTETEEDSGTSEI